MASPYPCKNFGSKVLFRTEPSKKIDMCIFKTHINLRTHLSLAICTRGMSYCR
jgi:hypothetical protein